ncbi:MAG: CtsR family transcriptional regulator [Oscillospiraceae bacterium]|jgi:transcriptional regulator CtsR|nr:CtsR family transcriptional regulator [Oscillospiraceae bacterium]
MAMSDLIEKFLLQLLDEMGGVAELQRGDLAERFSCVPSQINYVLTTRFSPEHGFLVESRRGGGGYIRITRVSPEPTALLMHAINAVGGAIDGPSAAAFLKNLLQAGVLSLGAARLIGAALGDAALRAVPRERRDAVRAGILKQCLVHTYHVL